MTDTIDYGTTILLPKTDFPRRAGLAEKEPLLLARWQKMGLYEKQRAASKGRKKFILHYGPPFANGHIHIGHVLSHTLKDFVCRSRQLMGFDAPLVPGYDCHGLPIEWKVEEDFRAKGKTGMKDSDPVAFRKACREYAAHWSDVQTKELQRIGILGDWKNPYSTMHKKSEALIAAEVHKFLMNGGLYLGSKPVMWSVPEQTALAEAEIEYKDVVSDTVFVKFPVKSGLEKDASVVIWTTTPWTLPGNRAVAYGEDIDYELRDTPAGRVYVMADVKLPELEGSAIWKGKGGAFKGATLLHPLHASGYTFDVPMLSGDFVTTEAGTGFVHIAPGHGEDDYNLGIKNGIEVPHTVQGDGTYYPDVPLFAGVAVYTPEGKKGPANKFVTKAIEDAGNLVAKQQISHSYPHSWRSKAPVIFRNTPQWFISMEKNDLRKKALAEIAKTTFWPERGRNRIGAMVEGRGDWNISRQRAWGVPLAIFVDKKTGEPLRDDAVNKRIIDVFMEEGSDAWFDHPPQHFLGDKYKAGDYEQIRNIIDVWFESGSTQGFVLEQRPELAHPADLYLEGSDQHRGWFQSSLLVSTGTRGHAPYKGLLTHGFILDEKGTEKMSKSKGNGLAPAELMKNYGADIIRLWVASADYTDDIRFGESILKLHADVYRRIRGTFCYLLGSIDATEPLPYEELSELDQWVLHKVHEVDSIVKECVAGFEFPRLVATVHNFCAKELSAFYFDVCKDTLYCDARQSRKRRGVVTTLDTVFNFLVHWLAPVLAYTCEEAWLCYKALPLDDTDESIHLSAYPAANAKWLKPELDEKWRKILDARALVTKAIELEREKKTIGASLEAAPVFRTSDTALAHVLRSVDMHDVCITSAFRVDGGEGVAIEKAQGDKCARCWKYTDDVGAEAAHPTLCRRCAGVVTGLLQEAA